MKAQRLPRPVPKLPMAQAERDPVCGMEVDPASTSVVHGGTTYRFCSSRCAAAFQRDPERHLRDGPTGMPAEAAEGNYTPLVVVIGVILLATAALSARDWMAGDLSVSATLGYFMAGFFLTFAAFKLMDLGGFAEGYATYDLLARRVPAYGYVYPFIELGFGLAMIFDPTSEPVLVAEILVMGFSGLGVAVKLAKREKFQCACLGTFLKVPLTKVTLIEDFGMAALGVAMLLA